MSSLLMYPLSTLGGCRKAAAEAGAEMPGPFCPSCGRYLEDSLPVVADDRSVVVDCPEESCSTSSLLGELHHVREAWADILWPRITELEQQVLVAEVQRAEMAKRLEAVAAGRAVLLADPLVCLRLQALAARLDGLEAADLRGLLVALGLRQAVEEVFNG